ncbi:MAG TPA: ABC transporter permease [Solirubrobacterales bacterium]
MEAASATAPAPAAVVPPAWRTNLATIAALMVRAKNELVRVPGAAIPGVLAPTIFFLGLNGVFGALTHLQGFGSTGTYESFIVPVSMLQGAGFTGAAAGVNLARDYEQGWVDRLLVSPAPRWVLLAGNVLAASARALLPGTFVLVIALALGASFPGIDGLLVTYLMVAAMAAVAACWGSALALHFKSQSAAPLMQAGMMALVLLTPAYAPEALLEGWLRKVAEINPVTDVVEAARQGFVGSVTWADTWPGLLALAGMLAVLGAIALREMRRTNV